MRPGTRKLLRRGSIALAVIILLAIVGFVWWALTPLGPEQEALDAMRSDDLVRVEERPEGIVFTSTDDTPTVGLVFYPGGRVDVRSYAPLAREIAERGNLVILVPMRLNLAVLSPNRADKAIGAHPEVMTWAIGGHSLGGAMAAQYAGRHTDTIDGLALLAAYPPGSTDLRDSEMRVTAIVGTRDGVLDRDAFIDAAVRLPDHTQYISIEGGNHAQFGSYGRQAGDEAASIPPEDQRWDAAIAVSEMLMRLRIRVR